MTRSRDEETQVLGSRAFGTPASIRAELPGDEEQIERVTVSAFANAAHTSHTEQHIVAALRRDGQLAVSLVAHEGALIVGHVALSPVSVEGCATGWFGLGPVSVDPLHQRSGIGSRLIRAALEAIRHQGALGCVVLGEPDYYGRFGFRSNPEVTLPGVPPEYFQVLTFGSAIPHGVVRYADAFSLR